MQCDRYVIRLRLASCPNLWVEGQPIFLTHLSLGSQLSSYISLLSISTVSYRVMCQQLIVLRLGLTLNILLSISLNVAQCDFSVWTLAFRIDSPFACNILWLLQVMHIIQSESLFCHFLVPNKLLLFAIHAFTAAQDILSSFFFPCSWFSLIPVEHIFLSTT